MYKAETYLLHIKNHRVYLCFKIFWEGCIREKRCLRRLLRKVTIHGKVEKTLIKRIKNLYQSVSSQLFKTDLVSHPWQLLFPYPYIQSLRKVALFPNYFRTLSLFPTAIILTLIFMISCLDFIRVSLICFFSLYFKLFKTVCLSSLILVHSNLLPCCQTVFVKDTDGMHDAKFNFSPYFAGPLGSTQFWQPFPSS